MIVVGLYVSVCIYNIPHFFLSSTSRGQCAAYAIKSLITSIYSWFSIVLNAIIPFTLLIQMNYVIVKKVRNSRKYFGDKNGPLGLDRRQKIMRSVENQ